MRSWSLTGNHLGSIADGLSLDEVSTEPPEPVGRQVVVRVRAAALNFRDAMILRNTYALKADAGTIPLSDGAGDVVAVGPLVRHLNVGDRVVSTYFPRWRSGPLEPEYAGDQFGAGRDGLLAEWLVCEEHELVRPPAHLSACEAATLPCSAVTAWSALTGHRPVLPGQTILTLGTGGVSLFVVQLGQLFGVRIIAATSSGTKAARLKALGADTVIDYSTNSSWDKEVLEATDGYGVDRVIETVGPQTLERSIRSTAVGGEIAHVGGGGFADSDATTFDPRVLHGRSLSLRRVTVGSRHDFEMMNRAIAVHRLRPVVDALIGFEDAPLAYERLVDRSHVGKVVVDVHGADH
ncbi:NAD(P)-dependent alcohol dehydrogenase [Gordonia sp. ABSL11-1]|uniref:zinc-dependent alcohol dehydrogenase family protein n=1 Tax=Gordonia sp. ABSL11-1 TaxID=3053924 RepID=UPI00257462FA|nr:NAD(P)-dependent alcohol dehydrogenase [Gordonia sp. ABSL11-1]MDL9948144.1 NAD(P)-dependent alcohol dehydrogenase [Gordonia sp. ABSL11-1]